MQRWVAVGKHLALRLREAGQGVGKSVEAGGVGGEVVNRCAEDGLCRRRGRWITNVRTDMMWACLEMTREWSQRKQPPLNAPSPSQTVNITILHGGQKSAPPKFRGAIRLACDRLSY